ncbi:MAG: hypothetical protein OER80_05710 [Gammaproteobacteria bacterium]|nr:hypothetical protein [Gammaproteobacteria bacterium]MDH3767404.1 hypothetical protein [Gammaproteobacteria bacterium]
MKRYIHQLPALSAAAAAIALGTVTSVATATEPCGDFGECKVLVEINSSDGDIGFHFLVDGDDLSSTRLRDPSGTKVFEDMAKGPLQKQKLTETFAESAEPLCWADPEADPDDLEDIVTLEEFLETWEAGPYFFSGTSDGGERLAGETELTLELPAAPQDLMFSGGIISWTAGTHVDEDADLGNCASHAELHALVTADVLPIHPEDVAVDAWEVVFEPDVDDLGQLKFTIRLPVGQTSVTVPVDYLTALPPNTPAKVEVGAIGAEDNATFTEISDVCANETGGGCDFD